jgi:formate hydrogenlyase subunit 3/multisubunit Na+/H+ antiporter MnhD subunit
MNAPLLWLVLPVLLAVGLYFLRHLRRITVLLGVLLALTFAVLAMWHPIGELITIGPISYRLESTLSIFGRQFILENSDRPILVLTHLLAAFWFSGAYITRTSRIFIPLSLVIVSLLTAALAVEPFLYAALIIELVALVSIPLLSPPGQPLARGVLRFLSFQTFGMPFILFVGWMLAGVETSPGDLELVATAMILIGLGFAFMLGIFPFHTWIPLLAEAVHPYIFSFILFTITWMVSLFGIGFFERYAWLRSTETAYAGIRIVGVIMILAGGLWAAFQNQLPRVFGYAIIVEIGFSLVAIGVPSGISPFFAMLPSRLISLGVWSLSLINIQSYQAQRGSKSMLLSSLNGVMYNLPVAASSLVLVNLSLAGFPLLAAFPIRLTLWKALAEVDILLAILTILGCVGLIIAGLRSLAHFLVGANEQHWQITESRTALVFLGLGIFALFLIGIFPQLFLPPFAELATVFEHLSP